MKAAKALLEKYRAGTCTAEENKLIDKWLLEIHAGEASDLKLTDFEQIQHELWVNIERETEEPRETIKLWPRIAVAVAAVAAITLGIWFYTGNPSVNRNSEIVNQNDVAPGKHTATLTLANGKTIQLSDTKSGIIIGANKLSYNDGSVVQASSGIREQLSASTPRGGTYQIILPDGTKVWLNADSKISFPSAFSGKQRKILLVNGEAYFEVVKNKRIPFLVESKGQQVEVLGTHFNISAYKDELSTKTTLLEGSVRVASLGSEQIANRKSETVILVPNQQAILPASGNDGAAGAGKITVKQVEASDAIAWQKGYFEFSNQNLESIMRQIARWYNVDVSYTDRGLKEKTLNGSVSRYDKVSGILNVLEQTGVVKFKIENKKIVVMPSNKN
ncbi:ferric-dicitrate binding protein FerR (iron transport regulator) [Pedobacter sp. AK017]|uniref:FecR family protein n=1 Tax=Pedobacter sp. AK017 TaxID=2723073 RepID=UPI00161E6175|nr:FecR domain-containing protein [Pedobacter sp. AK017]MBB5440068.1 ferric-dicitrate binding protein FerR (iron transport regulator) [Pedobacter sp. AK017]